mmetsp:Transcript_3254/g.4445  ORF Transcript_3254/g.4445 Transcript_3254/m.4445 type:complete len:769 (-) Transcript_3254:916-3222(-)
MSSNSWIPPKDGFLKLIADEEVRKIHTSRIVEPTSGVLDYVKVVTIARGYFSIKISTTIRFRYIDEDGDSITLSTGKELAEAWSNSKRKTFTMRVYVPSRDDPSPRGLRNSTQRVDAIVPTILEIQQVFQSILSFLVELLSMLQNQIGNHTVSNALQTPTLRPEGTVLSQTRSSTLVHASLDNNWPEVKKNKNSPEIMKEKVGEVTEEKFDSNFIHARHTCDGCGTSPIVGFRYHATNVPDFDLCSSCMMVHNEHNGSGITFERKQLSSDQHFKLKKKYLCKSNKSGRKHQESTLRKDKERKHASSQTATPRKENKRDWRDSSGKRVNLNSFPVHVSNDPVLNLCDVAVGTVASHMATGKKEETSLPIASKQGNEYSNEKLTLQQTEIASVSGGASVDASVESKTMGKVAADELKDIGSVIEKSFEQFESHLLSAIDEFEQINKKDVLEKFDQEKVVSLPNTPCNENELSVTEGTTERKVVGAAASKSFGGDSYINRGMSCTLSSAVVDTRPCSSSQSDISSNSSDVFEENNVIDQAYLTIGSVQFESMHSNRGEANEQDEDYSISLMSDGKGTGGENYDIDESICSVRSANVFDISKKAADDEATKSDSSCNSWDVVDDHEVLARASSTIGSVLFESVCSKEGAFSNQEAFRVTMSEDEEKEAEKEEDEIGEGFKLQEGNECADAMKSSTHNAKSVGISEMEPSLKLGDAIINKYGKELQQLFDLGFNDIAKNIEMLEKLTASNIGCEYDNPVPTVERVINHLLNDM